MKMPTRIKRIVFHNRVGHFIITHRSHQGFVVVASIHCERNTCIFVAKFFEARMRVNARTHHHTIGL